MRANQVTVNRTRRRFIAAGAFAAIAGRPALAQTQSLLSTRGGYRFLPGGQVFAGGAVALEGHEIVHAMLQPWLPLKEAYEFIERYLHGQGLGTSALCGMELRLPRQLSMDEFRAFNAPYVEQLIRWGLLVEGRNPISRTNVAPAIDPPESPSVHGFSFAAPAKSRGRVSFVMSGMTEIGPDGQIVAPADVSEAGLRRKVAYVIEAVSRRLSELGVGFNQASHIEFYAAHGIDKIVAELLAPAIDVGSRQGLRWHIGRPPVQGVEVELEARSVAREVILG